MANFTNHKKGKLKMENLINKISTAKYVTESLLEKTKEFALFISESMQDNGINSLMNGKYFINTINSSVGSDTGLYMQTDYISVTLESLSVSSTRETRLLNGDYNAQYNLPCRSDILEFIADSEDILIELSKSSEKIECFIVDLIVSYRNK